MKKKTKVKAAVKSPLKAKTVKLLERVRDHILEEPKRLEMGVWGVGYSPKYLSAMPNANIPACRTTGCIAGWAIMLTDAERWRGMLQVAARRESGVQTLEMMGADADSEAEAQKLLGITYDQAQVLFFVNNWPFQFQEEYCAEEFDLEAQAKLTAARINHFIKTGK